MPATYVDSHEQHSSSSRETIRILCMAGARPNFMKLAPLVAKLERDPAFAPFIVHTGQHYDDQMSGQFFRDLGMPDPKFNQTVGSGSHAR